MLHGAISARQETGMHLDARDAGDHFDVSGTTVVVGPDQTVGAWVKPTQLSSSAHEMYPGVTASGTGGSYNGLFTIDSNNGAGNIVTSGSLSGVSFWVEDDAGNIASSSSFNTFTMSIGTWHLVGFHYDSSVPECHAWFDGGSVGADTADFTSTSQTTITHPGYGYGDADDGGSGGKYIDDLTVFNRILTSTEWTDWYNGTHPGGDMDHRWKMDDDSDTTTIVDSEGTADGANSGCVYVAGDAPSA